MNSIKYLLNRAVPEVVVLKRNVSHIVLIRLMVPNVLLLERNKEYLVSGERKQFKSFRSTIKIYRDHQMLLQMNIGPIPLIADILNILAKGNTRNILVISRQDKIQDLPSQARDIILRLEQCPIIHQDQDLLDHHPNVLRQFNLAIL